MPIIDMLEAIRSTLESEMKNDPSVVVIGEDVGYDGGVFRATKGLIKQFGRARVMDSPLSETGILGTSVGMSINGLKPVAEIQFSGFIYPGFDQIISHAARMRTRTRGMYTCPMVIRAPCSGGVHAPEHHSESMEALYCHIPGLKVVIPSNPYDAKGLLLSAIRDPDPVLFLEPKILYRKAKGEVPEKPYTIPIGKANVVNEGDHVTLISWGSMMPLCQEAVAKAHQSNILVELIDMRTVSPLDMKTVLTSVEKTGRVVIVHEAPQSGGVGAEISARIAEKGIIFLKGPIKRVTGFDVIYPGYKLEKFYGPQVKQITKAIDEVMHF